MSKDTWTVGDWAHYCKVYSIPVPKWAQEFLEKERKDKKSKNLKDGENQNKQVELYARLLYGTPAKLN